MGLTWFQIREEKRRVREEKLRQKEEKRLARKQKQLMRQQLKLKKPLVIESCKFWFWPKMTAIGFSDDSTVCRICFLTKRVVGSNPLA